MDGWWSWDGRLYLLMAFGGVVVGCGEVAPLPEPSPIGSETTTELVTPDAFVPAMLADQFSGDAPSQPLCGDPLLGSEFVLEDAGLPTMYVDAAAPAAEQDGSLAHPFRMIGSAFVADTLATSTATGGLAAKRRVLVAGGYYDEDVAIPPGTLLLGGYDPQTWEQGTSESVISGSVYVGTATLPDGIVTAQGTVAIGVVGTPTLGAAPLSALTRFSVEGGVAVVPEARALLRENVISPVFFTSIIDAPDALRAIAVLVNTASLRADHNRLILPLEEPAEVISNGFSTWDSCASITQNEIVDYRSPIGFSKGPAVAATFNVLRRVQNGIGTAGNQALIAGNLIDAHMPSAGCVYAISMAEDAHPDIRNNKIFLSDAGNNGILEEDTTSLPTTLLGNRFYSPLSSPSLYVDHRSSVEPRRFITAAAVNALPGIPAIGDNTFALVAAKR